MMTRSIILHERFWGPDLVDAPRFFDRGILSVEFFWPHRGRCQSQGSANRIDLNGRELAKDLTPDGLGAIINST